MDKIQAKLEELTENFIALETCLSIGQLEYTDIILYLQYDIPIEDTNAIYANMKDFFQHSINVNRVTISERNDAVKAILRRLQRFIVWSDRDDNQARTVYKKASDVAEEICNRLDEQYARLLDQAIVPFQNKAAM